MDDQSTAVAIIGMSGRFPGARNIDEFWTNIKAGLVTIKRFDLSDLEAQGADPDIVRQGNYVPSSGVLDDADKFDAELFGYSPREAEITDPQHRVFMEAAWHCLEDGAYSPRSLSGARVGVFAGCSTNRYLFNLAGNAQISEQVDEYSAVIACGKDFLATRVSYKLNLTGPSITIQTACSTSLVAVHFACQSLLNFESDMAIAGGVHVQVPVLDGYVYREGGILSRDGHCRPFDIGATGTVPGSGVGVVLLKRLSDALRDGDGIYAVIRGSAINNDGSSKVGYTAPAIDGQSKLIAEAMGNAGVMPDQIRYVETHGTGTSLGDAVEIAALKEAFGANLEPGRCLLGSTKGNIGHLDSAAGIAGLIKAVLCVQHGVIPPSGNFSRANPKLELAGSPFAVCEKLCSWPKMESRIAGISSFGIGGTNAHVIIQEPPVSHIDQAQNGPHAIVLSARNRAALDAMRRRLAQELKTRNDLSLAAISRTLRRGRVMFSHRTVVVANDLDSAAIKLTQAVDCEHDSHVLPPLALVIPGSDPATFKLPHGLYTRFRAFRNAIDECKRILDARGMADLADMLQDRGPISSCERPLANRQIANFCVEYALAKQWLAAGIAPSYLLGYGFGEYVAGVLADIFALETAFKLVAAREQLLMPATMSIEASEERILPLLEQHLTIQSCNAGASCSIAGRYLDLQDFHKTLTVKGIACGLICADTTTKTPVDEALQRELEDMLLRIELQPPKIPMFSNVTGRILDDVDAMDPSYWTRQLLKTLRFSTSAKLLRTREPDIFWIESGTQSVFIRTPLHRQSERKAISGLRNGGEDSAAEMLEAIATMWTLGFPIKWEALEANQHTRVAHLTGYPFAKSSHWVTPDSVSKTRFLSSRSPQSVSTSGSREALPQTKHSSLALAPGSARSDIESTVGQIFSTALGYPNVDNNASFFSIGGDSLLAAQVVARLRQVFGVELPLKAFFDDPTVSSIARYFVEQPRCLSVGAIEVSDRLVPSFGQQRLWFLEQLQPGTALYNIPAAIRIHGPLNALALRKAIVAVVERHQVLRTVFADIDGHPRLEILNILWDSLQQVDLRGYPCAEQALQIDALARAQAREPFDLKHGPLLRALLAQESDESFVLFLTLHHIAADGWSLGVLLKEFAALYSAFINNLPSPLPPLLIQYSDYAAWQRHHFSSDRLAESLAYWRENLADAPSQIALTTDRPRPAEQSFDGERISVALTPEFVASLRQLARDNDATLFMVLLAAFQVVLGRYADQDDILVGTPVANRLRVEAENLIGFFVNTLVVRTRLYRRETFESLLTRVRNTCLAAYSHQDLPFEQLVDALNIERNRAQTPLFQVMFALNKGSVDAKLDEVQFELFDVSAGTAKFDLSLELFEDGSNVTGYFEFCTALFDRSTIDAMDRAFRTTLAHIISSPIRSLAAIDWTPIDQRLLPMTQVTQRWNYAAGNAAHELFESLAKTRPQLTAVRYGDQRVSYFELEQRATALAITLVQMGIGKETLVGFCMQRSVDMIASMLAIWKTGAAYLPLDPSYPGERLELMLRHSQTPLVIVDASAPNISFGGRVLRVDHVTTVAAAASTPVRQSCQSDSLAYVIYTSGSTGQPKGVAISHGALSNFIEAMRRELGLSVVDRVLASTSVSFDIAVLELIAPLTVGAEIDLLDATTIRDAQAFSWHVDHARPTVIQATPAAWRMHLSMDWNGTGIRAFCGGEALPSDLAESLRQRVNAAWNLYGPTETTVWSSALKLSHSEISIGTPILNTSMYILDFDLNPLPPGVEGDLYIGGHGVARGYWRDPGQTAFAFIPDPFAGAGKRMYRTGDRAKWRKDGCVEFIGRRDNQVKIRGYRIELGEVESALSRHEGVESVVVVAEPEPTTKTLRLVAFVKTLKAVEPPIAILQTWLRTQLPAYMIPAALVIVEEFPLTPSGKIDRKRLVRPEVQREKAEDTRLGSDLEYGIAQIWSQLLNVVSVGPNDDFFRLGGHSLLATQIVARLRQSFGVEIPLKTFFDAPTVSSLARFLAEQSQSEVASRIEPAAQLVASFGQHRLWFLEQLQPGTALYNIPAAIRIDGPLDTLALQRGIATIVERHQVLRTVFDSVDGQPNLRVLDTIGDSLEHIDLRDCPYVERASRIELLARAQARTSFDLMRGPLLRAVLVRESDQAYILLLTLHHIAADGWSLSVLFKEFAALYAAFARNLPSPLVPLAIQYADYAAWQRQHFSKDRLAKSLAYWCNNLANAPAQLALPTDRPRRAEQSFDGERASFLLAPELTTALKKIARDNDATLFMVLLAAFQIVLGRYADQDDILVGTPIANRTRVEVENLIGFFVNTLVMRTRLHRRDTFLSLLSKVRATCLAAYSHQDLPFEQLVDALNIERNLAQTPLFQVMFGMIEPVAPIILDGLNVRVADFPTGTAKFDLEVLAFDSELGVTLSAEYNSLLFPFGFINGLLANLDALLRQVVHSQNEGIFDLQLINNEQHSAQLTQLQGPIRTVESLVFHEVFERIVERAPNAVAVTSGARSLTYRELNQKANSLAHALLAHLNYRTDEQLVGVLLDRDIESLVSMLAIFKAGLCYTPLDPGLPPLRLRHIASACSSQIILTSRVHADLASKVTTNGMHILIVEEQLKENFFDNPRRPTHSDSLAYVIFTSGSTGEPKGAMIHHGGMLNHLLAKVETLGLVESDVVAVLAAPSFDVHVWQFCVALLVGARCEVFNADEAWDAAPMLKRVSDGGISILETVPTHLGVILSEVELRPALYPLTTLRCLVLNGETLHKEVCDRWISAYQSIPIVNAYGPTECSDDVTQYDVQIGELRNDEPVPITGTLQNLALYILGRELHPVATSMVGYLFVSGIGVGRGYLNDPARTATSFLPDPFSRVPGARMYATGDRVRTTNAGHLHFLGRSDTQVKIRGHRVELQELESVLSQHPAIREAGAIVHNSGTAHPELIAYYVARLPIDTVELIAWLGMRVPTHMVPFQVIQLDEMPRLPNGKIARSLFPAPSYERTSVLSTSPRTPTEESLSTIWKAVLEIEDIGVHESFFKLGGQSLLAVQLTSRIRTEFGVHLPVRTVFDNPTVSALAPIIESTRRAATFGKLAGHPVIPSIGVIPQEARFPCAAATIQLPEWYTHQLDPLSAVYNICFANMIFTGKLDVKVFVAAWNQMVRRHEVLRMAIQTVEGEPHLALINQYQSAVDDIYIDCKGVAEGSINAEIQRLATDYANTVFDFENGPLVRIALAEFTADRFLLIFVVHHIIWDETSTMNFSSELTVAYNAIKRGAEPAFAPLPVQYIDYAHWINGLIKSGQLDSARDYWRHVLHPIPAPLALPTDFPRPAIQTFAGAEIGVLIPPSTRRSIYSFIEQRDTTLFIFLLAVLESQLYHLTSQRDFVIGAPIANRGFEELEKQLGLFATALPLRASVNPSNSFEELLSGVRENAVAAYDHYLYPSVLAIRDANPTFDPSRNRLFSVMFGVQNNKRQLINHLTFDGTELSFVDGIRVAEDTTARFDLTYIVDFVGEDIEVRLNYNTDLFQSSTAASILGGFTTLIDAALNSPSTRVGEMKSTSVTETAFLEQSLYGLEIADLNQVTLPVMFETATRKFFDYPAVLEGDRSYTYCELDNLASQYAASLTRRGLQLEQRVAILARPSFHTIAAVLGILKAGGSYVPLNREFPKERCRRILRTSNAVVLFCDEDTPDLGVETVRLFEPIELCEHSPTREPLLDNSAYVIFTSGTTGEPKGIDVTHRSVTNVIQATQDQYHLGPGDILLWTTPLSFDASVLDIFWPLTMGAAVAIASDGFAKDARVILKDVEKYGVTVLQTVPAMLDVLVDASYGQTMSPKLRQIICGGAYLSRKALERFKTQFQCSLANHYGPTECTIDVARFDCEIPFAGEIVPIGSPLRGTRVYILNPFLQRVAVAALGEIYVGGIGITRGYVGEPASTALSYLPDPFGNPGDRMYRTGDLGRIAINGQLQCLGRIDRQVKIRGNRVELDEIEARLMDHSAVVRSATRLLSTDTGSQRIAAYVELDSSPRRFQVNGSEYEFYTMAQIPKLREEMIAIHRHAWPEYFVGDEIMRRYWPQLNDVFPSLQFALVDATGNGVAIGNAAPIAWDGNLASLGSGWDQGLQRAFDEHDVGVKPNTLFVLAGTVAPSHRNRGLSRTILECFAIVAGCLGLKNVVVPVRPTRKPPGDNWINNDWILDRRPDGQLVDPWLRTHEGLGGKILGVAPQSQCIRASIADWERWAGRKFIKSGDYMVEEALQPVSINLDRDEGVYFDPSVWVAHEVDCRADRQYMTSSPQEIRAHLRDHLPEYMIPETLQVLHRFPISAHGKVDLTQLPSGFSDATLVVNHSPLLGTLEQELGRMWSEVLGVDAIGADNDFFALGGDSLSAVRMLTRLQRLFNLAISLREFFGARTVRNLASLIARSDSGADPH